MRVLIACEYSGRVRDAFAALGHDAMSCDLLPSDAPGKHYQGDVRDVLNDGRPRSDFTEEALAFVRRLLDAPIEKIALENPVGCISTKIRKPSQIIQPWQFGEDASKSTCLWLKNLPPLKPEKIIEGVLYCCGKKLTDGDKYSCPNCNGDNVPKRRWANQTPSGQNKLGPSADRWKLRSTTYQGIANAMAAQWGGL